MAILGRFEILGVNCLLRGNVLMAGTADCSVGNSARALY